MVTYTHVHMYVAYFETAGVYPGVMTEKKWLGSRVKERWDEFVRVCPKHSQSCDKVPNWARRSISGMTMLGRTPGVFPIPLQHVVDEILLDKLQLGMELSPEGIAQLIETVIVEYNEQVNAVNEEVHKAAYEAGKTVKEFVDEEDGNLPCVARCVLSHGNLTKLANRFADKFCWGRYKNEKPGKHLDYNSPQVVQIHAWIAQAVKTGRVH